MSSRLVLPFLASIFACDPGAEHSPMSALSDDSPVSADKTDKVDVCHITGNGSINILNISSSAVAAHIGHGDHLAGTYFLDADGDGDGDPEVTSECLDDGYVENDDDCDDDDDTIYVAAEEICGDDLDNDCDGDIDEDCTVEVEIHVNADNGVWAWVDGEPVDFDYTTPNWYVARSATLTMDTGDDHAFAFYVEDWGGLAYFAASIRVDGQVVAATGGGDFTATGALSSSYVNEWPRIADWANVPDDASDSLNLLFSPGTTWGDWMEVGFDDSGWDDDSNVCTSPSYWNVTDLDASYTTFGDLADDGAEFVWYDFGYWSQGSCYSVGDSGTAWRTEVSL